MTFIIPVLNGQFKPGISRYSECDRCKLSRTRKRVALERYGGSGTLKLMFIGEAPGEVEDKTGYPFTGRAGKILNFIFRFAQKDFRYLITNAIGCRPCDITFLDDSESDCWTKAEQELQNQKMFEQGQPDLDYQISNWNRDPTEAELNLCKYHLTEMEQAFKPDGIVYLGRIASTYKTQKPTLLLKHPSWIDRLDYKLLPTRIEAKKLSQFIENLQNDKN